MKDLSSIHAARPVYDLMEQHINDFSEVRVSRRELAALLGIRPGAANRAINRLIDMGVLQYIHRGIGTNDPSIFKVYVWPAEPEMPRLSDLVKESGATPR